MTGPDKLLTISVAAYNAEPYLERCISSVVSCPDAARLCEIIIEMMAPTIRLRILPTVFKAGIPKQYA